MTTILRRLRILLRTVRAAGFAPTAYPVAVAPSGIRVTEVHTYYTSSAGHLTVCLSGVVEDDVHITGWFLARDVRVYP